jgi:hypothetical protein
MIRLAAALSAVVLLVVPLRATPIHVVVAPGVVAMLLAVLGIVTLWRWPVTAAACLFVTDYALALTIAGPGVSLASATCFGLALLGLLHSLEVARCARRAAVHRDVARSQILGWVAFVAVTAAIVTAAMVLARGVAPALPFAAAPLLAAAGALGVVVALAFALRPSART